MPKTRIEWVCFKYDRQTSYTEILFNPRSLVHWPLAALFASCSLVGTQIPPQLHMSWNVETIHHTERFADVKLPPNSLRHQIDKGDKDNSQHENSSEKLLLIIGGDCDLSKETNMQNNDHDKKCWNRDMSSSSSSSQIDKIGLRMRCYQIQHMPVAGVYFDNFK